MESHRVLAGEPVPADGRSMPMSAAAELFKAVAHPVRAQILALLADGESTIPELCEGTGVKATHLSRHLAQMRGQDLIRCLRYGGRLVYRLAYPEATELLAAARSVLQARTDAALSSLCPGPMPQDMIATALHDEQFSALERSLVSRSVIMDACQLIAARLGCSTEEAAGRLIMTARTGNQTVLEAAREELRQGPKGAHT
jgi:DNA-binding transcriptional ArsR family regulator